MRQRIPGRLMTQAEALALLYKGQTNVRDGCDWA